MRAARDGRPRARPCDRRASSRAAYELLAVATNPIPIKAALTLLGHEVGGYRLPLVPPTPEEHERVAVVPRAARPARRRLTLGGAPAATATTACE